MGKFYWNIILHCIANLLYLSKRKGEDTSRMPRERPSLVDVTIPGASAAIFMRMRMYVHCLRARARTCACVRVPDLGIKKSDLPCRSRGVRVTSKDAL